MDHFSKEFLEWWAEHEPLRNKNYDGSTPMMEVEGALRIFGGQYQRIASLHKGNHNISTL